jgi:hypothetical protein
VQSPCPGILWAFQELATLTPAYIVRRSPSPEPIYGGDGKRINTREFRKRKELEEQRHEAIQRVNFEINTFKRKELEEQRHEAIQRVNFELNTLKRK